ncbi:hypothetical protein P154DRAFT_218474 [Amniculicola lignicola CBS 123094]|uniref:SP-RING-type domain-containing protein n=1 Tax=Amniculicola lignicola CBS 123094 TaxID=1392246 RepID=A0A6A5WXT3_9PLEO|nr:hypothetical protein P154DRAFT_218474 [Amniculicola lignicola CBS 123094]
MPGGHHEGLTPREREEQQRTLNRALGGLGGRQKAWMAQNTPAVPCPQPSLPTAIRRGPGRPRTVPQVPRRQPPPAAPASPVDDVHHREKHPPSNSTSPYLANVVSIHDRGSPRPSPAPVLPSPAPSEDANPPESAPTPTPLVNGNGSLPSPRTEPARMRLPNNNSAYVPETQNYGQASASDVYSNHERHQVVAGTSKRPGECSTAEVDKRIRLNSNLAEQPSGHNQATPTNLTNQPLAWPSMSAPREYTRRDVHSEAHSRTQSPAQIQTIYQGILGSQTGRTAPLHQGSFEPQRSYSRDNAQPPHRTPQEQQAPSPLQSPVLPHLRQPTEYFTKEMCLTTLRQFENVRTSGQFEPKRVGALRSAIDMQDWAYLTIHQYFCLLDVDPTSLPSAIQNHPNRHVAYKLLSDVLGSNEMLSPEARIFFANFPFPLHFITREWSKKYNQELNGFRVFMNQCVHFGSLRDVCMNREYPPLVRELAWDLGIASTVLQKIAFTAIFRRMWTPYQGRMLNDLENIFTAVFEENRMEYMQSQANRPASPPPNYAELERNHETKLFAQRLRDLTRSHKLAISQREAQAQAQLHPAQQLFAAPATVPSSRTANQPMLQQGVPAGPPHLQHPQQAPARRGRPPNNAQRQHSGQGPSQAVPLLPRGAVSSQSSGSRPLLPPPGFVLPQQREPNPTRFGLHQAHLTSPILRAQEPDMTLYQYVKGFVKEPTRLTDAGHMVEKWLFSISPEVFETVPDGKLKMRGALVTNVVNDEHQRFRLRCIKWPSNTLLDQHTWAIADTSWPSFSYFTLNKQSLQQRRKLHHGKDLPINLSVSEGDNTLEIAIMRESNDHSYLKYLLAIEIVGMKQHGTIIQDCLANRIPAAAVLKSIKSKLSPSSSDDEIVYVQSTLTINLFDPFSASKICDIPVRGRNCLHYDCFDLETFLQTRPRKGGHVVPDQLKVSVVDQWKCPISGCNGDVRPQHLVVDGFLEDVRKQLEKLGLLDTRAILVHADGTWEPKPEPHLTGVRGDGDSPSEDMPFTFQPSVTRTSTIPSHVEVIDLSD